MELIDSGAKKPTLKSVEKKPPIDKVAATKNVEDKSKAKKTNFASKKPTNKGNTNPYLSGDSHCHKKSGALAMKKMTTDDHNSKVKNEN